MPVFHAITIGRGVTLITPDADGSAGQYLKTDGAGGLSFDDPVAIGSPVGGGTPESVLFIDDDGKIGEDSLLTWDGAYLHTGAINMAYNELKSGSPWLRLSTPSGNAQDVDAGSLWLGDSWRSGSGWRSYVLCGDPSEVGQIIQAAPSQTGNLWEVRDSAGNAKVWVESDYRLQCDGPRITANDLVTLGNSYYMAGTKPRIAASANSNYSFYVTGNGASLGVFGFDGLTTDYPGLRRNGTALEVIRADRTTPCDFNVTGTATVRGACFQTLVDNSPTGTTQTIDWTNSNKQLLDVSGASGDVTVDFASPDGPTALQLLVKQGATSRDITWPSTVKWDSDSGEPDWSSDANVSRIVNFLYDGTNYYAVASGAYS